MAIRITLELPDEVARVAGEAARRAGLPLETVLTDWLDQMATHHPRPPRQERVVYPILTPYGNEDAAQVLLDVLAAAETDGGEETEKR
jgi:hypothetical protein